MMKGVEFGAASGAAPDDDEATMKQQQAQISMEEVGGGSSGSRNVHVFGGSGMDIDASPSGITAMESGSPYSTGRKSDEGQQFMGNVRKKDVENIFRRSKTTGAVSNEQIARIKKMHDKISDGVDFNFNYYCLLMVASVIAGLGLATDSSTTVISSMLLSPIMGPVIGMSYGLVIWDVPLINRSARNEICSIVICIIYGLIIGICTCWTDMAEDWPTQEMLSRGTRTTFLAGIPIAFFSGLGVALSVLDDSTSSLVGVAISASLLPPAVNCGMLWIVALGVYTGVLEKASFYDFDYFQMGGISLGLTVANVVAVWIGAAAMFRMKEVLPIRKRIFWEDLGAARKIYQNRAFDESGNIVSAAEHIVERPKDDPVHLAGNEVKGLLLKRSRSYEEDHQENRVQPEDIDLEAG